MDSVERGRQFDDIDEAEEEALLKSDDENEATMMDPKSNSGDIESPSPLDEEDSLMMDGIEQTAQENIPEIGEASEKEEEQEEDSNSSEERENGENGENGIEGGDEDDDEDDEEMKIGKEYYAVLKELEEDQFAYDKYLRLCQLAHATTELDNIRNAYKLFSEAYPLSPELWFKYLEVEKSVAQSETELKDLIDLYAKALQDYYSLDLALDLAALVSKFKTNVLDLWEELLASYGISCIKGREFFKLYRKYIQNVESFTAEQKEKLFIASYLKELRLPLLDMEESFIEFKLYYSKNEEKLKDKVDMERFEAEYYQAKADLQKLMIYEKQLETLESNQYRERAEIYMNYIRETDSYLDENILQTIYERMVADCCLNENCWMTYIDFVEFRDGVKRPNELADFPLYLQSAIDINKRALRNCVWSERLYIKLMTLYEDAGAGRSWVTGVLEKAMAAGFQTSQPCVTIWMEYLTYLRRQTDWENIEECENVRKNFDYAWTYLSRQWGEEADPSLEILKLWGRLEYGPLQDPAAGKAIWNTVMEHVENASKAALWIEFTQMEMRNDLNSTRNLYRTALQVSCLDDPLSLCSVWERFERCNGTAKTLRDCLRQCSSALEGFAYKYKAHVKNEANNVAKKPGQKRKANDDQTLVDEKKAKMTNEKKAKRDNQANDKEGAGKDMPFKDHENQEIDFAKDHLRIFLSNLDYKLTEDEIREALAEFKVVSLDLIRSANGKSRGFCYIELENEEEVAKALKKDGSSLKGRPLYVSSVLRDKQQRQKFKYSDSIEPKKLFVKGLPNDITKEQLEEFFGPYGKLVDVRLVYHKSGKFKNIAYVEYEDEPSAGKAVLATNNAELEGHKLIVAISAPPPKPSPSSMAAMPKIQNVKRNKVGEQKPRMSLIPNVIRKKFGDLSSPASTTDSNSSEATPSSSNTNPTEASTSNGATTSGKTNEDFRKLLLQ